VAAVTRSVRLLLCVVLTAGALLAAGCGEGGDPGPYGNVEGETEATYLELGGLKYQIQVSRQLNPNDTEDRAFLQGVPPQSSLRRGQVFFGVFLRVENDEEEAHQPSGEFVIEDTQEQVFRPVPLGPENPFRYVPLPLQPGGLIPVPDSPAWHTPVQGALILFRIEQTALENRPLEFIVESPVGTNTASVSLDV
jgi:hypothetical protein